MTEDEHKVMEFLQKYMLRTPSMFTFEGNSSYVKTYKPVNPLVDTMELQAMRERYAMKHGIGTDGGNTVGRDSQHVECDPDRVYQL